MLSLLKAGTFRGRVATLLTVSGTMMPSGVHISSIAVVYWGALSVVLPTNTVVFRRSALVLQAVTRLGAQTAEADSRNRQQQDKQACQGRRDGYE